MLRATHDGAVCVTPHWQNSYSISLHIEWDMIVVTVFLSIFWTKWISICVQNRKENCHYDHIPFNFKGNRIRVFSVNPTLAKTRAFREPGIMWAQLRAIPETQHYRITGLRRETQIESIETPRDSNPSGSYTSDVCCVSSGRSGEPVYLVIRRHLSKMCT